MNLLNLKALVGVLKLINKVKEFLVVGVLKLIKRPIKLLKV
jgi:hypothetical protein